MSGGCSKNFKDLKAFIEYSKYMKRFYSSIEKYNPRKDQKALIVFLEMIADMISKKKLNPVINVLFIRGRMFSIFLVFSMHENRKYKAVLYSFSH